MLRNVEKMAEYSRKRLGVNDYAPEIFFNDEDKRMLNETFKKNKIRKINKCSFEIEIDGGNSCVIPSQYLYYAVAVKESAINFRKYMDVFDRLKKEDINLAKNIKENSFNLSLIGLDPYSNEIFLNPFIDKKYRLDAKDIINNDKNPNSYKFRGVEDFFGSVILKIIDVPDSSSNILGKIIYELSSDLDKYHYFENRFLQYFKSIVEDSYISSFVYNTLIYLEYCNSLNELFRILSNNNAANLLSIKTPNGNLTSIFRVSDKVLKEKELESGGKPRFFSEPFLFEEKYYYLSTEWTNERGSRLDLDNFIRVFNSEYSDLFIEKHGQIFQLKFKPTKKMEISDLNKKSILPKPFILLAGISGTGKTRFVRKQAEATDPELNNYCIVAVRPDWHEPSDLLGYISRINGVKFVSTPFLKFMIKAWQNAYERVEDNKIILKSLNEITPYWLCLDEMNLAPVEQYFADYLSVLETRKWNETEYTSDPLLNKNVFTQLGSTNKESLNLLRKELEIKEDDLWDYFVENGIQLPPNLIVAGTVNMDETTHGFSRKVIDRALTIDFGEFYTNDYNEFFEPIIKPKTLNFSNISQIKKDDLLNVISDAGGTKSIKFIKEINSILRSTPFELAYRALNELLLSVICFEPENEDELCAVWDDFLMQKVLPRIEGDTVKLRLINNDMSAKDLEERVFGKGTLLHGLYNLLASEEMLGQVWNSKRPDLLRENINGAPVLVECRSKKKLEWMMKRLKSNHFTDFWV